MQPERLGRVPYLPTVQAMQTFTEGRDAQTADALWICEHPPVYTQGLAGKSEHIFNPAEIPVVQLSLSTTLDPALHLAAGRALQALRQEGVLIIGSGMSYHNMRGYGDPRSGPISDEFDDWLTAAVQAAPPQRQQSLIDWAQAPSARLSHPPRAEEHLLPLMVVAGAAGEDAGLKVFTDRVMETTLSAFRFGPAAA